VQVGATRAHPVPPSLSLRDAFPGFSVWGLGYRVYRCKV
jgi:hypothetical protein